MTEPAVVTAVPAEPADDLVSTHHTIRIGRRALSYTATAGRVVLREEKTAEGKYRGSAPRAEMSVTAYVLDAAGDSAKRPVVFAFNGGPGSSSVWLHLGCSAPDGS